MSSMMTRHLTSIQEVVAFLQDRNADVRQHVIGFVEDAW